MVPYGRGKPLPYVTTKGRGCGGGRWGAGGVEPRPYGVNDRFYGFAVVRTNLQLPAAREGQAPPLRYD